MAAAISHQQHSVVGQFKRIKGVSEACVVVDAPLVVYEVRIDLWGEDGKIIFNTK